VNVNKIFDMDEHYTMSGKFAWPHLIRQTKAYLHNNPLIFLILFHENHHNVNETGIAHM
jgi:hypothetical protein